MESGLVGVFDSGVGGLSVLRELIAQAPEQPFVYLADQAHTPYGQRSLDEIRCLAEGITGFLLDQGARVIVIACNTASAAALRWLRGQFPNVAFVGMEPAIKPAVEQTRSGHVGVIATDATFHGELFASLLDRYAGHVQVHQQTCPELVPLIEAGELDTPHTRQAISRYLAPMLAAGIDRLVLGCTHYPFVRPLLEEVAGPHVVVVDPAPAVARQTRRVLAQSIVAADLSAGPVRRNVARATFYTTGEVCHFQAALVQLLGVHVPVCAARWAADGRLAAAPASSK